MSAIRQHSKGRKRPRAWHRGRAGAGQRDQALVRLERAIDAHIAKETAVAVESAVLLDDARVWRSFRHAAPFVPDLAAALARLG